MQKTLFEMVENIAARTNQPTSIVKAILKAEQEAAAEDLAAGYDVPALNGALKLSVGERAARTGRNPQTGETIQIAASKTVKAKVLKKLKDAVC